LKIDYRRISGIETLGPARRRSGNQYETRGNSRSRFDRDLPPITWIQNADGAKHDMGTAAARSFAVQVTELCGIKDKQIRKVGDVEGELALRADAAVDN